MPQCGDAELLQVLVREARKNRLVYLVLAECRLILAEAQAPQPDHDRGKRRSALSDDTRYSIQDDLGLPKSSQGSLAPDSQAGPEPCAFEQSSRSASVSASAHAGRNESVS